VFGTASFAFFFNFVIAINTDLAVLTAKGVKNQPFSYKIAASGLVSILPSPSVENDDSVKGYIESLILNLILSPSHTLDSILGFDLIVDRVCKASLI
jgi:uncharacterized protein YbbC (DUF1343 family)